MIAQQAAVSTKASHQARSKAGCVTCKTKHAKCDETRPACKRCASKGLVCGGYQDNVKWTFKHLVFQPPQKSSDTSTASSSFSTSPTIEITKEESRKSTTPRPKTRRPKPAHADGRRRGSRASRATPPLDERVRQRRLSEASTTASSVGSASDVSWATSAQQRSPELARAALVPTSPVLEQQSGYAPRLVPAFLTDNSSAFVISWFQEVCPAWSGFDSDANWNRKIAIDLWQSSATVRSALESMSASFLASRLPSLRQASLRLMSKATESIQEELEVVKSQQVLCTIPTGLLFAMFCMGTTICWVDSRCLGLPFFRELRILLRRLNSQPSTAWSSSGKELLDYFNQSMVYCEMLLAVVSVDQRNTEPQEDDQLMQQSGMDIARAGGNIMLHPWTGISMLSSRLFAESIRLCRESRSRMRQPGGLQMDLTAILQDLLRAQSLEERLLALEINPEQHVSDTGDLTTPESHLALVAEAYRVSALLHLYQTFSDLAFQRLPATGGTPNDATLWHDWIAPLALHLVKTLEQIPPSSGTRVIQPLLYISASTGLRHSPGVPDAQFDPFTSFSLDTMTGMDGWGWMPKSQAPIHEANSLTSYVAQVTSSSQALLPDSTSDLDMQISRARHFIMKRLGILESSLPPAPIVVAKELVSTIWNSYDNDVGGLYMVHWIDVMELNDLRSMFG